MPPSPWPGPGRSFPVRRRPRPAKGRRCCPQLRGVRGDPVRVGRLPSPARLSSRLTRAITANAGPDVSCQIQHEKRLQADRRISATSAVATEVRSGSARLARAYTEVEFTLTALAAVEAVTALPAAASTAVGYALISPNSGN